MKKRRILLNQIDLTPLQTGNSDLQDEPVGNICNGPDLMLKGEYVNGFSPTLAAGVTDDYGNQHPEISGWPEKTITFQVPEEDMPRVRGWFSGDYQGVTKPKSATLIKNMQTAVTKLLTDYDSATANHNLFKFPGKFAWCLKSPDGVRTALKKIEVKHLNRNPPSLPILHHYFEENQLHTKVQIRNIPARLMFLLREEDKRELQKSGYETLEIYSTKEGEYRPIKSEIFGISSKIIDGIQTRCWIYDSFSSDEIEISRNSDDDFRRIFSIPLEEIETGNNYINLPISSALLASFESCLKYKASDSATDSSSATRKEILENHSNLSRLTHFISEPLDLGNPEDDKHLYGVTLFGIFNRMDGNTVKIKLYASHHREQWRLVATSRGNNIHGLRRTPFRWWRVEIEVILRPGDLLEAITFRYENCKV